MSSSYELGPHYESFVRGKAGLDALKADIRTGIESGPGIPADDVFDRLEARYGGRRS
jgi:antitoxin ParD1/3/4